eukprot:10295960-Alexandrium_andersonii.AAC.1
MDVQGCGWSPWQQLRPPVRARRAAWLKVERQTTSGVEVGGVALMLANFQGSGAAVQPVAPVTNRLLLTA